MSNLNEEERKLIDEIQQRIGGVKRRLRRLYQIQKDANRPAEANAAYLTLGELMVFHGRASERMMKVKENSGPVVFGGGGRD